MKFNYCQNLELFLHLPGQRTLYDWSIWYTKPVLKGSDDGILCLVLLINASYQFTLSNRPNWVSSSPSFHHRMGRDWLSETVQNSKQTVGRGKSCCSTKYGGPVGPVGPVGLLLIQTVMIYATYFVFSLEMWICRWSQRVRSCKGDRVAVGLGTNTLWPGDILWALEIPPMNR
jgi:hypothetical protein